MKKTNEQVYDALKLTDKDLTDSTLKELALAAYYLGYKDGYHSGETAERMYPRTEGS